LKKPDRLLITGFVLLTALLVAASVVQVDTASGLWLEELRVEGSIASGTWAQGCVRTQGYWSTHSACGPNARHRDPTWDLVGEGTAFFTSGQTWCGAMWVPVRGDMYWNLAQQFVAATLNALSGASMPPEVMIAYQQAQNWLAAHNPGVKSNMQPDYSQGEALKTLLDDYNNGRLIPAHCEDSNEEEEETEELLPLSQPEALEALPTQVTPTPQLTPVPEPEEQDEEDQGRDEGTGGDQQDDEDEQPADEPTPVPPPEDGDEGDDGNRSADSSLLPENSAPLAGEDSYEVAAGSALQIEAPGVLANDTDADADTLTAVLDQAPAHGTLALAEDGSFTYTPEPGFTGEDVFTYHAFDGQAGSEIVNVTLVITGQP